VIAYDVFEQVFMREKTLGSVGIVSEITGSDEGINVLSPTGIFMLKFE